MRIKVYSKFYHRSLSFANLICSTNAPHTLIAKQAWHLAGLSRSLVFLVVDSSEDLPLPATEIKALEVDNVVVIAEYSREQGQYLFTSP